MNIEQLIIVLVEYCSKQPPSKARFKFVFKYRKLSQQKLTQQISAL